MTEGLHRFYGGRDLHFLTFSCYRRRPLFVNEVYCDLFLKILERVRRRYRLVVLGYVVMPEHVHLLVSEPQRRTWLAHLYALPGTPKKSREGIPSQPSLVVNAHPAARPPQFDSVNLI